MPRDTLSPVTLPPRFYVVTTDYGGKIGFGTAGDATTDRNTAFNFYIDAIHEGQPVRAVLIDLEAGTAEDVSEQLMTEDV